MEFWSSMTKGIMLMLMSCGSGNSTRPSRTSAISSFSPRLLYRRTKAAHLSSSVTASSFCTAWESQGAMKDSYSSTRASQGNLMSMRLRISAPGSPLSGSPSRSSLPPRRRRTMPAVTPRFAAARLRRCSTASREVPVATTSPLALRTWTADGGSAWAPARISSWATADSSAWRVEGAEAASGPTQHCLVSDSSSRSAAEVSEPRLWPPAPIAGR
mmetsp:Transcript_30418/g.94401  ORF Transcript_30418/g.94401 Transcript_30418/m.94401 type:complete len:215 (+) Transcript_30418:724-1368(+)